MPISTWLVVILQGFRNYTVLIYFVTLTAHIPRHFLLAHSIKHSYFLSITRLCHVSRKSKHSLEFCAFIIISLLSIRKKTIIKSIHRISIVKIAYLCQRTTFPSVTADLPRLTACMYSIQYICPIMDTNKLWIQGRQSNSQRLVHTLSERFHIDLLAINCKRFLVVVWSKKSYSECKNSLQGEMLSTLLYSLLCTDSCC